MPSHTINTINMEKLICNLWHKDENIANLNLTTTDEI